MASYDIHSLRQEYVQLFATCGIHSDKSNIADGIVEKILSHRAQYEKVQRSTNVPWYFIAVVHSLEADLNFQTHLHNGDPLTHRTVKVPAGRPVNGTPPFTWEASAIDALHLERLDVWEDWSLPGILYKLESYNGFGTRDRGILTPYLWSYSNHYTKGKFIRDHVWDANAVSDQCGAAVLLKRMEQLNKVYFEDAKLIVYRKGKGEHPVAVIGVKIRNGVSYAYHNEIAKAIGDEALNPDTEIPVKAYLSGRYTVVWHAESNRIFHYPTLLLYSFFGIANCVQIVMSLSKQNWTQANPM